MPASCLFKSEKSSSAGVVMNVEEYECIRLIDYMGYNQADCARQMQVSRATVQTIYSEARKKIARFIVEGINLSIDGGDYELCNEYNNKNMLKV